jgi:DNA-binding SARP family transcriptional activator
MRGSAALALAAFRSFPFGIVVFDYDGKVVVWNRRAEEIIGHLATEMACCELLGCRHDDGPLAGECLTQLARTRQAPLPEVRLDLDPGTGPGAAWVAAAPLAPAHEHVVVQLRPGDAGDRRRRTDPHWVSGPQLSIRTLGRTAVDSPEGPISGRWLERRSGELLKLLLTERARVVHTDEIIEALWPGAGPTDTTNVRFVVHSLRQKLEPHRGRSESSFILARQGGYTLDRDHIWIDADVFERYVADGRSALADGDVVAAERLFREAVDLYEGDFLADELYATWVQGERDRLRSLMSDALSALADSRRKSGDIPGAAKLLERLAAVQPYDMEIQREATELMLMCGRRSDAVRHYRALRKRMMETFGEEPQFKLSELRTS